MRALIIVSIAFAHFDARAQSGEQIKIGRTVPYSGAASLCGTIGGTQSAYFD